MAVVVVVVVALLLLLLQALDLQRYALPVVPDSSLLDSLLLVQQQQQQQQRLQPLLSNNSSNDNKPTIFLHYGPAKTGTSTLQSEMTAWKDRLLQLDNVLYVGAYYSPNNNFAGRLPLHKQLLDPQLTCSKQMGAVRLAWEQEEEEVSSKNNNKKETLASRLRRLVPCLVDAMDTLAAFHANHTSLLFSNEVKSTAQSWGLLLPGYNHAVSQDWKSWHALLADDWNFVLILGHRPYLDWVSSGTSVLLLRTKKNVAQEWVLLSCLRRAFFVAIVSKCQDTGGQVYAIQTAVGQLGTYVGCCKDVRNKRCTMALIAMFTKPKIARKGWRTTTDALSPRHAGGSKRNTVGRDGRES